MILVLTVSIIRTKDGQLIMAEHKISVGFAYFVFISLGAHNS